MKLHQHTSPGLNVIDAIAPDHLKINQQRYAQGVIVHANRIEPGWAEHGFDNLSAADFARLLDWQAEVILIGTGTRQRFPAAALLRPLLEAQAGFEIMDSAAACRTYNVLVSEGRAVVAAIMLEPATGPTAPSPEQPQQDQA